MAEFPGNRSQDDDTSVPDQDPESDQDHQRDLLDGAVDPAVARVRDLVDGGLVGWARRRVADPDEGGP